MAFHGNRGGSRGRGSGSGPPRGRGGARGGSRGRGGFRGGKRPIFDSARVAQKKEEYEDSNSKAGTLLTEYREENEKSESESPSEAEEQPESEEDSSDEDDEPLPAVRSYSALMQSLTADSAPQAKRRKLEHPDEPSKKRKMLDSDSELEPQEEGNADLVEEDEEGPETAAEELSEDEDEDSEDASDSFEAHFADPEENVLSKRLKALQLNHWITQKTILPKVGKAVASFPQIDDVKTEAVPPIVSGPGDLKLKQKLAGVISKQTSTFDSLESSIAGYMFNYQDILYCERSPVNSESLRRLACLHAVNHVFK